MDISTSARREFISRLLLTVGVVLAVCVVIYAFQIILLIFAGCLLAILLTGLSSYLRKYVKIPESLSLILVIILIIVLIAFCSWLFGQQFSAHLQNLGHTLQKAYNMLLSQIEKTGWGASLIKKTTSGVGGASGMQLLSKATVAFSTTLGMFVDFLVIIFVGLFLAFERKMYTEGFKRLFPKRLRPRVDELLSNLDQVLRWWMLGQFIYMLTIGILATIGLEIMGIPMALSLGIVAMVFSFVPYLGTIISVVPAMLIALTISGHMALYVLGLYLLIHMIDAYLLAPLIQLEAISLPPALTICSQILMGYFAGILGLLVATPLIAVIIVLVQVLYVRKVLSDDVALIGEHEKNAGSERR